MKIKKRKKGGENKVGFFYVDETLIKNAREYTKTMDKRKKQKKEELKKRQKCRRSKNKVSFFYVDESLIKNARKYEANKKTKNLLI
jgi:hypothetical protein